MSYSMPPEWASHEATLIAWPHNVEHWPGNYEPIPKIFAKMAVTLAKSEKVYVCVNDAKMEEVARGIISGSGHPPRRAEPAFSNEPNVSYLHIPTNASWSRDHGPIVVRDEKGNRIILDFIFNCWGEKYPPWDLDDAVPQNVGKFLKLPVVEPGIVLEGGSIDVNGLGSLLTTRQCLLNKNRNPHLNQNQIEGYLEKYLGATNVLWLEEGIVGDDTDGHIDDIAKFVNETTIVFAVEEKKDDENYSILQKNYEDLKKMKDQDGQPFTIIPLPMPDPVVYEGKRLPASYLNFYIANTIVLVPTFRCSKDEQVLRLLAPLFPGREVRGIDSVDWVWGLGTVHCSTQQIPSF